jgi:hypothetical protein
MKSLIKRLLRESFLKETNYQDRALDNLSKLGSFYELDEIDKLILIEPSQDEAKLKRINLSDIFRELGGTFGKHMVKVKIKDLGEQRVDHKFSKEMAGQIGWLTNYIHYDDGDRNPYVTVTFDDLQVHNQHGDSSYKSLPIMLANMYPIGYGDEPIDFAKHAAKRDMEIKDFLRSFGLDDENSPF